MRTREAKRRYPEQQHNIRDIFRQVASLNNLKIQDVEHVFTTQWKFVKAVIEEGNLDAVSLPQIGKFYVKPGRIYYLNKRRKSGFHPKKKLIKELVKARDRKNIEKYEREIEEHNKWVEELRFQDYQSGKASREQSQDMFNMLPSRHEGKEL